MRRSSRSQRGFTLIELMVVVGLIAILAAIVVPGYFRESRKTRGTTEVNALFAELMTREEAYKVDNGAYLTSAACPATPSSTGANLAASCISTGSDWANLRVSPPESKLYCSYAITSGTGTGTDNPAGFTFTSPTGNWYYVLATCDMDGSSTTNSTYFASSVDSTIQKLNEGS